MDFSSESIINTPTIIRQKPGVLPPLRSPAFLHMSMYGTGGRGHFLSSEYDLREIGRIEDTESLLMQAFQKKLGLMFKEGWDFIGPNIKTVEYIKRRFAQMAQVSGTSIQSLLRDMGSALIKKSNCFLVKVRKASSSGGRIRTLPGSNRAIDPIAAYFSIPAETMQYKLAANGKRVVKWEHAIDESKKVEFVPDDIIHMTFNRKEGFIFGTPSTVPVIDDIRALRKIEENVELLIYQHLFPLFHYKIGSDEHPAGYTEDGQQEISVAKQEVRDMPAEGGIITDHRHDIKLLGMEGRALRADGYLEYFKKRVLAGLGISAVDIGEGNTANRATADNMSRNLVDSVKDIQVVLESLFNEMIINELLLEADFSDLDPLDEKNKVSLKFKEIDVDAKIKKDNHYADLFNKNAISHDEMRIGMGLEPIELPTQEESRNGTDTSEKYRAWHRLNWKLFEEPKMMMQAMDEPWSLEARSAVNNPSLELGQAELNETALEREKIMTQERNSKSKPNGAKDYHLRYCDIAKNAPTPAFSIIRKRFDQAEDMIIAAMLVGQTDTDWIRSKVRSILEPGKEELLVQTIGHFYNGYMSVNHNVRRYAAALQTRRFILRDRIEAYVQRLVEDLVRQVGRQLQQGRFSGNSTSSIVAAIRTVFDTLRYRANYIDIAELRTAYILGKSTANYDLGRLKARVVVNANACTICQGFRDRVILTDTQGIGDLPPFHPNCTCDIEYI